MRDRARAVQMAPRPAAPRAAACWAAGLAWWACAPPAVAGPSAELPLHLREDKGATALAHHVTKTVPAGSAENALHAFDLFSKRNRLGMHLGEEKGQLIMKAVKQGMKQPEPITVLEMGCHAGDGSLRAAMIASTREGSRLISTEANEHWLEAAKEVVAHGTSGKKGFEFLPMLLKDDADFGEFLDTLRDQHGVKSLDTVIFDTNPSQYANHLKVLLKKGMLRKGATIYVDNGITKKPELKDYLGMVKSHNSKQFSTDAHHVKTPYTDAVLITTYLGEAVEL